MRKIRWWALIPFLVVAILWACAPYTTPPTDAQKEASAQAQQQAKANQVYIPHNHIELTNYNKRMEISDDPTTIIWCTSFPLTQGQKPFTVPVVGKLTSGSKRPYPTSQAVYTYQLSGTYNPELAGPDGMYGTSGEYRYGFTPGGFYADFYDLPTFCTTEPMIWQTTSTEVVMKADPALLTAQNQARDALRSGDTDQANSILEQALGSR